MVQTTKITLVINPLKHNDYEEKQQYLGSPFEDCYRSCNRSSDSIGNNSMHGSIMDCVLLSPHITLDEFLNVRKYPDNKLSLQHVVNMTYGCLMLLEPARQVVGPILKVGNAAQNLKPRAA